MILIYLIVILLQDWQAALQMTGITLDLLTVIEVHLFIKADIRGGGFYFYFFYLVICPTSYERAQNTRLHRC